MVRPGSVLAVFVLLVACGDNKKPQATPDATPTFCGNGILEAPEQCDDDDTIKDKACDATCRFTCGNGILDSDVGELCDVGVPSGPGSCPSSCDDGMACTDDATNSSECTIECVHSPITAPTNGDDCCPAGANANTDDDCMPVCGNMVVEAGEACDTGITTGPGRCPTSCNDSQVCTTDVLMGMGTCNAACTFTPITLPMNNDGCCPPGANPGNDNDCAAVCGNGVVETGETCDTGITSGPGACPTPATCNDNNACTTNSVGNPGTCQAFCQFPPITAPANNDGCCPPGANANNDNDCDPVCPNGVTEPGEECDDGNMTNNDACSNTCRINPTAFRFTDLDLRDPHVFVSFVFCLDVTDTQVAGFAVNSELQTSIQQDDPMDNDTLLDLSPTLVFRQFSQTAATQPIEMHFANCTAPMSSTTCSPDPMGTVTMGTATNMSAAQCMTFFPGTVRPYSPAITPTNAPCFVSNPITLTIELGGIPITLQNAQVAARYVGNPATTLANGMLRGFISEADANATILPDDLPVVGGEPLSRVLAGGNGACPGHSDKDTLNGVTGWWFYLNFPAARVPWSE